MKFFLAGVLMMLAGIPLLNVHFYVGTGFILVGGFLASWFKGEVMRIILAKAAAKGQQMRDERQARHRQ